MAGELGGIELTCTTVELNNCILKGRNREGTGNSQVERGTANSEQSTRGNVQMPPHLRHRQARWNLVYFDILRRRRSAVPSDKINTQFITISRPQDCQTTRNQRTRTSVCLKCASSFLAVSKINYDHHRVACSSNLFGFALACNLKPRVIRDQQPWPTIRENTCSDYSGPFNSAVAAALEVFLEVPELVEEF